MEAGDENIRNQDDEFVRNRHFPAHGQSSDDRRFSTSNPWNCWSNFSAPYPPEKSTFTSYKQYFDALKQWLVHYQTWNQMNLLHSTIPYYTMGFLAGQQQTSAVNFNGSQASSSNQQPREARGFNNYFQQIPAQQAPVARPVNRREREYHTFKVAAIWKRVAAEFVDFFLLFAIKLGLTILTIEYVGIIDVQKYDIDFLFDANLDYNTALSMTTELVALEVINRIFITVFETLCLRRGIAGQSGGTTPGKRLLGIKVVSCEDLIDLGGHRVQVLPAGDIGMWNALVRSVIKNFSLAFFFPVCFTVFFFQNSRAAYDIISNCIVVEENH